MSTILSLLSPKEKPLLELLMKSSRCGEYELGGGEAGDSLVKSYLCP